MTISAILLAGGHGSRMQSDLPKQYLLLQQKAVALHSLEIFLASPEITQVIVVCDPRYHHYFKNYPVTFAPPGARRQDSLYEGLKLATSEWICVHDAARPFITLSMLSELFEEGKKVGAATLGMPVKWTVKESGEEGFVKRTLNREQVWEIQTPQFLSKELLEKGFVHAQKENLTVTDDVSLAELLDHPVKLVKGAYSNLKITTPDDLLVAERLCLNTKS